MSRNKDLLDRKKHVKSGLRLACFRLLLSVKGGFLRRRGQNGAEELFPSRSIKESNRGKKITALTAVFDEIRRREFAGSGARFFVIIPGTSGDLTVKLADFSANILSSGAVRDGQWRPDGNETVDGRGDIQKRNCRWRSCRTRLKDR